MSTLLRTVGVGVGAVAVIFCGLLGGCDDDDSGDGSVTVLHFGTSNIQECEAFSVDVDLQAAEAVLARNGDGSPDCLLDTQLDGSGCSAEFEELDGGNILRANIEGCVIPNVSGLFACSFTRADSSKLMASSESICDCEGEPLCDLNIYCLTRPGICVGPEIDPGACEDCFNSIDDDGDGFTDCDDANCFIPDCGVGQTTVTCSSTSTTNTSSTTVP